MHTHTAEEISHPTGKNQTIQLKDIQKKLPLRILSQDDWQHWITKGFVVVKNAVSRAACQRLENVLWEFDEKIQMIPLHGLHRSAAHMCAPSLTMWG